MQKSELKDKIIINIMKGMDNDLLNNEDLIVSELLCDCAMPDPINPFDAVDKETCRKCNLRFIIDNK